jgi:hypothetical protein
MHHLRFANNKGTVCEAPLIIISEGQQSTLARCQMRDEVHCFLSEQASRWQNPSRVQGHSSA